MARTYRRRHVSDWESFVLSDHIVHRHVNGQLWFQRVTVDRKSEEGRRLLARYHSDKRFQNGPPRSYRRPYHHSDRQACRQAIFVWVQREDHDFLAPAPHLHSAGWDWF